MGSGSSKASSAASTSERTENKQPLSKTVQKSSKPAPQQNGGQVNGQSSNQQTSTCTVKDKKSTVQNGRPAYDKEKTDFELAKKRISTAVSRKAHVQKKFSRGFSMAKIQAKKEKCTSNPILLGDINQHFPPTAKIVRIFTSSTFTDTKYERNSWMVHSYPRIQSFCRDHGYEFQVVDMRWGVRDEAADDHSAVDLCLKELEQCQKLSTGPNFVSLLSHKYGYRNLLKQIEAKEFEQLLQAIDSTEDKELLTKWYKRDDNAVPPVYVLQRISTQLPDFISSNVDDKNKAKAIWWIHSDKMQDLLAATAEKCLGPEKARNYLVSVTEREVQMGLLDIKHPETCCIWFKRNIEKIEDDIPSKPLSRYIDCLGEEEKWKKSRKLLSELKEERMSKVLPSKNIVQYNVNWKPGGIDPENKEHAKYLKQISEDLVTYMQDMIDRAIKEREKQELVDPLLEECKQHIVFCQEKCHGFQGREDILKRIKAYVTGNSENPLVIHGFSGCGKTSIMAMAAKLTKSIWKKQAVVLCRFIGTTPDSSTIGPLLKSLILQIRQTYGLDKATSEEIFHDVESIEELKEDLITSLGLPLTDVPLVIYLDSLDQLDTANGGRSLSWLPEEFSASVKIVVSTLEDRQYEAFPKLKTMLPDENFVHIPDLSVQDAKSIIQSWLQSQHRILTSTQNDIVVKAFNKCSLALFLKLSLDEACQWSSFTPPNQNVLQKTVRDSINSLFHRLEVRYGDLFVSRTLGYVTIALNGLSETELEDILSCDDDVLNDLYQYWTPPIRRLPPLLLVRLKTDLQQYLVDRGADGVRVIYWYHRQFIEAAQDRYCTKGKQSLLHSALADFFAGTWSNGNKKPFENTKNKTKGIEDRLVTAQPYKFKDSYNYRKLGHLPYHRIKAGQLEKAKSECLCNFKFLQTKLIAMTYRNVFRDLNLARNTFENDKEISWITDAFKLSEYALSYDPYQLAPHMIDRLSKEKIVSGFIEQCRQSDIPYLASSDEVLLKPGGELIHTMTGHTSVVKSLDVTANGSTAVTCGQFGDDVIRTWSLKEGKLQKEYDNLPTDPEKAYFADKYKKVLIHYRGQVVIINIANNTREKVQIPNMCQLCVFGPDKSIFGTFIFRDCTFYNTADGKLREKVSFDKTEENLFDIRSCTSATSNYVALTNATEDEFYVINITTKELSSSKRETTESYTVDAIVITPSQKTVICASFLESTIRLHDIKTLKILKQIKTRDEPYEEISNFHVTRDGKYLYFPCYREVIMINLKEETETRKFRSHPDSITDVYIYSDDRAVTITQDPIVRLWDMSETNKASDKDKPLQNHRIVQFKPLPNLRHVVVIGNPDSTQTEDYYMYVYDLVEKSIVQSTELDEGSHLLEVIDDNTVLVLPMSLKPKTIDLQTMTIKTVFQGRVCDRCKLYKMTNDGKEFICVSRGRRNIKVYSTTTGKVIKIHKSPADKDHRIDNFFTNKSGSTIVAKADESFIIFDTVNGRTSTVTPKDLKMEVLSYVAAVCPNGNHVVLSACKIVSTEEWESEPIGFLWNVQTEKSLQLVDSVYHMKYKRIESPLSVALDEVQFLDDEKVVSAHDDYIIRIWDIESGKLVNRLTGHSRQAMLTVPYDGPYFLSYGFMDEEVIKLWDRNNFKCLSSFKFDTTLGKLNFCGDNETFITSTDNPVNIVHWSLHGQGNAAKALKDYPKIQRKNYNIQLEIETDGDMEVEPDDPDTDPEEQEDSEEECSDLEY
ncbi:NACHT domain- and WD repeat-containing protein 1-like isoform X2 [Mytilus californianus]|uniref:NACHT domain- and WD repeat-containing protein 1-like isoform X2 n=1 Tax=Mytilus californianus TaxID=6549 RepID=UPI0022486E0D|nr:NACHT domain- and WD repeat-containing protein 1-like isoform X2 [Mytilus californianus]